MQGQLTSDPILLVPENFDSPPENYQDLNEEGFELKRHSTPSTPGSKRRLKNSPSSSRKLERRHLQSSAASQLNSFNAAIIDLVKQAAVVKTPESKVQSEEDKELDRQERRLRIEAMKIANDEALQRLETQKQQYEAQKLQLQMQMEMQRELNYLRSKSDTREER